MTGCFQKMAKLEKPPCFQRWVTQPAQAQGKNSIIFDNLDQAIQYLAFSAYWWV